MLKINFLNIITLLIPSLSYAILCPNNFNQIEIGDPISKVIQLCGSPNSKYQYTDTLSLSGGVVSSAGNGTVYGNSNYYQTTSNT